MQGWKREDHEIQAHHQIYCHKASLWHYTSNGSFSVKSVYWLAKRSNLLRQSWERGESSSGAPLDSFWKTLWSLPIPNKVKMFLWRCSHNVIAVLYNMNRKGIDISPYCPRCKTSDETLEHLLFQCKFSRAVWLGFPFSSGVSPSWNSSQFMDWWHSFPHNV